MKKIILPVLLALLLAIPTATPITYASAATTDNQAAFVSRLNAALQLVQQVVPKMDVPLHEARYDEYRTAIQNLFAPRRIKEVRDPKNPHNIIATAVKIPESIDYEVYVDGRYIYNVKIRNNVLYLAGFYRDYRPPFKALLKNAPPDVQRTVNDALLTLPSELQGLLEGGPYNDKKIRETLDTLPPEIREHITASLQIQLVKPLYLKNIALGNDGLVNGAFSFQAWGDYTNNYRVDEALPVVRSSASINISASRNINSSIDLSGLADGIYTIQEAVTDGLPNHQDVAYWQGLVVVVHKGVASLQMINTNISINLQIDLGCGLLNYGGYGTPDWRGGLLRVDLPFTSKLGTTIYSTVYANRYYTSDWHLCTAHYCCR